MTISSKQLQIEFKHIVLLLPLGTLAGIILIDKAGIILPINASNASSIIISIEHALDCFHRKLKTQLIYSAHICCANRRPSVFSFCCVDTGNQLISSLNADNSLARCLLGCLADNSNSFKENGMGRFPYPPCLGLIDLGNISQKLTNRQLCMELTLHLCKATVNPSLYSLGCINHLGHNSVVMTLANCLLGCLARSLI